MLKRVLENLKKGNDGDIHDEYQYISLISDILKYGELVTGRNGNTLTKKKKRKEKSKLHHNSILLVLAVLQVAL